MNEFEKKLLADLQAGYTAEDILAEFQKHLDVAAKEQQEAEAKKKAEAAAQAARAERAKEITDLANRMLDGTPTAADVANVFCAYVSTKWNKSQAVVKQMMSAEEVDEMVNTAIKMLEGLEPLVKLCGMDWDKVAGEIDAKRTTKVAAPTVAAKPNMVKRTDDDVIKDFIQKIM